MSASVLSRPLPRSWGWSIAVIAAFAVLSTALNLPKLHVYLKYWGAASPRIAMPYQAFGTEMDEQALRAKLAPLGLRCEAETQGAKLGERVCWASLDEADGAPAMSLACFFRNGHLAHVVIDVPWWGHHAMVRRLLATLGAPTALDGQAMQPPLMHWRVAHGTVSINRAPGWDPLAWSVVMWNAQPLRGPARSGS